MTLSTGICGEAPTPVSGMAHEEEEYNEQKGERLLTMKAGQLTLC